MRVLKKMSFSDRNFYGVAVFEKSFAKIQNVARIPFPKIVRRYFVHSKLNIPKFLATSKYEIRASRHYRKTSFLDMSPIFWRYEKNKDTLRRSNLAKESVHGLHFDHGHTYIPILETFCP